MTGKPSTKILPGKEKVIEELRRLAKDADTIYLATDLDREGEAIAWHLREAIGGDESRYKRVVFNEITKKAIQEAFSQPGELDINRVNAQQARRFLDRVVGYMVSPLLWAEDRPRPVRRARAVGGGQAGGRAREGNPRLRAGRILGSRTPTWPACRVRRCASR